METNTKILLGVGVLAAAGVAYYFWSKNKSASLPVARPAPTPITPDQIPDAQRLAMAQAQQQAQAQTQQQVQQAQQQALNQTPPSTFTPNVASILSRTQITPIVQSSPTGNRQVPLGGGGPPLQPGQRSLSSQGL